ncbi:MAG: hypothetical protein A3G87_03605 [Omnitrophica bacterium RIFCSPLOWO2_12_FULL_50_11]|nr:MAG: hypothetical protein A3G87_03605 [Omnitrophica bacterium RIFCSPLOWO2_12_FULL_50_11]
MSIITEALKKAERDRAVKERRTQEFSAEERAALTAAMESERLVAGFLKEREKRLSEPAQPARVKADVPPSAPRASNRIRLAGTVLGIFGFVSTIILVLYALTRWPDVSSGPSIAWDQTPGSKESEATPIVSLSEDAVLPRTNRVRGLPQELPESSEVEELSRSSQASAKSEIAKEVPSVLPFEKQVTEPIPAPKPAEIPFVLSGISVSGRERYALINGRIVTAGDWVDGAFVKEILDHEAIIETRTEEIKLKLLS